MKEGDLLESILTSIKKLLGIDEAYTTFDVDLIMHINSAFMVLTQLGVGPSSGFTIKDSTTLWSEFIPETDNRFEAVKTYLYMKVRLSFDPPMSSIVMDSMKQMISEYEWRLNMAAESQKTSGEEGS